jgi:radical SAM superfamily enzyme YgiQ (UPF0313 family)
MLYDASTNKYPKYFPHPMLLLKYASKFDEPYTLLDLNLQAYNLKMNTDSKLKELNAIIEHINNLNDMYSEVVINMGEFPPDADKNKYFDIFLNKIKRSIKVMGMYPTIEKKKFEKYGFFDDTIEIIPTNFDVHDVELSKELLEEYPKVNTTKLRASMKLTYGCPRKCNMCPTALIYKQKYEFFDVDNSIAMIQKYYDMGVRYITFTDDNLSADIKKFVSFLEKLKALNLKGMSYICQEGFEVIAFKNKKLAPLLVANKFEDIKIGFENINEKFLKQINKYYSNKNEIDNVMNTLKENDIRAHFLFLIGGDLTEDEIMENLKFISSNGMIARVNVIREYEGNTHKNLLPEKKLYEYKALANAMNFYTENGIDLFADNALEDVCTKLQLLLIVNIQPPNDLQHLDIEGKCYFGFERTNKFIKGLTYLLEKKVGCRLKVIESEKTKIVWKRIT